MTRFADRPGAAKWTWLAKLTISVALMTYVLTQTPIGEIRKSLADARILYIIFALFLLFGARLADSTRMYLITVKQGLSLSILEIFKIGLMTTLYGTFLPGIVAGGAIRWYLLTKKDRKGAEAFASMTLNRLLGITTVTSLGAAFSFFSPAANSVYPGVRTSLSAITGILLLLYLAVLIPKVTEWALRAARGLRFDRFHVSGKLLEAAGRSLAPFHLLSLKFQCSLWALAILSHALVAVLFFLLARSLGLGLPFVDCVWVRSVVALASMLPISFHGIGVRDTVLVVLLAPLGVAAAQAVALSWLLLFCLLVSASVGGVVAARDFLSARPTEANP